MDELRIVFEEDAFRDVEVKIVVSRGPRHIAFSPLYLARTLLSLTWGKLLGRIDLVHINLSQDGSAYRKLIIAWLCRRLRFPYALHLHGSSFHQFWDSAPAPLQRALTTLFAQSALTIVLGTVWAKFVERKVPSLAPRIVILPTATRDPGLPVRPTRHGPCEILFSGRLGERKGVPELTAALGKLANNSGWTATLTGDGDIEKTRDAVKRLGIEARVSVPGWIGDQEFDVLLSKADIFVLPSLEENLPLSVVEAFARCIAVICTPVGALPDIVEHERTGLLVKPGDVDSLTAALQKLLHDAELRTRLGKNARTVFEEKLAISNYAGRLVTAWRSAAQRS